MIIMYPKHPIQLNTVKNSPFLSKTSYFGRLLTIKKNGPFGIVIITRSLGPAQKQRHRTASRVSTSSLRGGLQSQACVYWTTMFRWSTVPCCLDDWIYFIR
jgi:hypothetical protein